MTKVRNAAVTIQHHKAMRHASHGVYLAYYAAAISEARGIHLAIVVAVFAVHALATLTGESE